MVLIPDTLVPRDTVIPISVSDTNKLLQKSLTMHDPLKHNKYMNRLDSETRVRVIGCLVEGCSIRSTVRLTGVSKKCVMRLLIEAGAVASKYQDQVFRNLTCQRIQVDEQWAFIGAKAKNVTARSPRRIPMLAMCVVVGGHRR